MSWWETAEHVVNQDPDSLLLEIETTKDENRNLHDEVQEMRDVGSDREKMLQEAEEFLKVQESQMQELHRQFSSTVEEVSKYETELRSKDEIIAGQFDDIRKLRKSVRGTDHASVDTSKIQEQNAVITALQDEIEILRLEKVQRREEEGKRECGRSELEEQMALLERTLQQRENLLQDHEKELRAYTETTRQSQMTLEQREKELHDHDKELRVYKEASRQNAMTLEQREKELRDHDEELRASKKTARQSEMTLEQSENELLHHKEELRAYKEQGAMTLDQSEKELRDHEKELRAYKEASRQGAVTLEQRAKELRDHKEELRAYKETARQSEISLEQREKELRGHKEELLAYKETTRQSEMTLEQREKELRDHDNELRTYKETTRQSTRTLEQREKELRDHEKELLHHKEELRAYKEQSAMTLEQSEKELRDRDKKLRAYKDTTWKSTMTLEQRDKELLHHKDELRACKERSHRQEMVFHQKLEQSARRLSSSVELRDEVKSTNEKLEEDRKQAVNEKVIIAGAIQEIHNELAAKEKELSITRHNGEQQQKRASELKAELVKMADERNTLKQKVNQLGESEAKASGARVSLERKIDDILQNQLIAEKELVALKNARIQELNTRLNKQELDVSALQRQLENAEQRVIQAGHSVQGVHEADQDELKVVLAKREEQLQLLEDYLLEQKCEEQQLSDKLQKMEENSEENAQLSLAERAEAQSEITCLLDELRGFQNSREAFDEEMKAQESASQVLEDQLARQDQELSRRRMETAEFRMILSQRTEEMAGWKQKENERTEANSVESRVIIEELRAELTAEKEDKTRISALLEDELQTQQQEFELHKELEAEVIAEKTEKERIHLALQDELQMQEVELEPPKVHSATMIEPMEETPTTLAIHNFEISAKDDETQILKRYSPVLMTTRPGKTASSARGSIRSSLQASYSKLTNRTGAGHSAPSAAHPISAAARMLVKDSPRTSAPAVGVSHELPDALRAASQRINRHKSEGLESVVCASQFFSSSYASQHSPTLHLGPRPDPKRRAMSPPVIRRDTMPRSPQVDTKREILRKGMGTGGYPRRGNLSPRPPSENGRDSWIFAG